MANQFTKADEEGRERPKGTNQFLKGTRKAHDQATKDKIRAEVAATFLEKALRDKKADLGTKVAAAKALLPYGKSTFASIEQTNHEEPVSEADIMAQLSTLLANPGTKAQLQAMLAGSPTLVDSAKDDEIAA